MLPQRYYPVLNSDALKRAPVGIERLGTKLVLWRDDEGVAHAFVDRCPHRGVALSLGRVEEGRLVCRYHSFAFDRAGACRQMPCEGADAHIPAGLDATRLELEEHHGLLWLWWGPPPPRKRSALRSPGSSRFRPHPLRGRTSDGVAGQHRPHVGDQFRSPPRPLPARPHHSPELWPGRVDPIEAHVDGERLTLTGRLRKDRPDSEGVAFEIQYLPPTLTWFSLAKGITFVVADCPIDAHRTRRYARYYTALVPVPGLGKLVAWLMLQLEWSLVQKRQDLPVVITQQPQRTTPGCDKLVHADVGIARFLKLYRHLHEQALADRILQEAPEGPALRRAASAFGLAAPAPTSLRVLPERDAARAREATRLPVSLTRTSC